MGEVAAECIHGLTADWCQVCKTKGRKVARRERRVAETWEVEVVIPFPHATASYAGVCPTCGEAIESGETIYVVDGVGWVDEACAAGLAHSRELVDGQG